MQERHEELQVRDIGSVSYEALFKDNILTGTPFIVSGMDESVVFEGVGGSSEMLQIYDACLNKASAGNTKVCTWLLVGAAISSFSLSYLASPFHSSHQQISFY